MMPLRAFPGVGVCGLPGGWWETLPERARLKVAVKGVFVAGLVQAGDFYFIDTVRHDLKVLRRKQE
jgi:hypothetical protein